MFINPERMLHFGILYGSYVGPQMLLLVLTHLGKLVHCIIKLSNSVSNVKDRMVSERIASSLNNGN